MIDGLNQRQRLFIYHYSQGKSITSATVNAGYTSNKASAAVIGSRLLRIANVKEALDTLNDKAGVTPSRLVSNLSSVITQIKNIEFRAGDYVKIMEFMLRLNGIYLKQSPTSRKPPRKKLDNNFSRNPFLDEFFKKRLEPNPMITESKLIPATHPIEKAQVHEHKSENIKKAVPNIVQKAIPTPAPHQEVKPAYSMKSFKKQEDNSFGSKAYYPA